MRGPIIIINNKHFTRVFLLSPSLSEIESEGVLVALGVKVFWLQTWCAAVSFQFLYVTSISPLRTGALFADRTRFLVQLLTGKVITSGTHRGAVADGVAFITRDIPYLEYLFHALLKIIKASIINFCVKSRRLAPSWLRVKDGAMWKLALASWKRRLLFNHFSWLISSTPFSLLVLMTDSLRWLSGLFASPLLKERRFIVYLREGILAYFGSHPDDFVGLSNK